MQEVRFIVREKMEATPDQRRRFGQELRRLRDDAGLTLEQVAAALGEQMDRDSFSRQAVGAWERGEYAPRQRAIIEALEEIVQGEGRLAPLLGFGPIDLGALERLAEVEAGLAEVREIVGLIRDELADLRRAVEDS